MPNADLLEAKRVLSDRFILGGGLMASGAPLRRGSPQRMREAVSQARQNVHAVGIGRKVVEGKRTGEPCVRFYVTQKLPMNALPRTAVLPAEVDGVPTDVIESPPAFVTLAAVSAAKCTDFRRKRQRPVRGGISAGHKDITAGTIAYFVRSLTPGDNPKRLLVLSNNHVFANVDEASPGDALLQPGPLDGGAAADLFATLHRAHSIDLSGGPNLVDAAVGLLKPSVKAKLEICSIGKIVGTATPKEGGKVRKHGRTSGLTFGTIVDTSVDAVVGMDHMDPSVKAVFTDQLRIEVASPSTAFGLGGDSGSLVVTRSGKKRAVGLYFAGPASGTYGLANPIKQVLSLLDIKLAI